MTRQEYADLIIGKIGPLRENLARDFSVKGQIPSFFVDDLLPQEKAEEIYRSFPLAGAMVYKKSLRERKSIAAQMNLYAPILEEIIYAFQDPRIVKLMSEITGIKNLIPDEKLYAGGISRMDRGDYLNPHLDNSHDGERKYYRILNLLYYVTPGWEGKSGGNLELWDSGPGKPCRTILSRFNRLVVMATGQDSWHSVNEIMDSTSPRTCVSNYYFSPKSLEVTDYFHVTSFRGRPEEPVKDFLLRGDNILRQVIRLFFPKGIRKVTHIYKK